ncbi:MAG TPA: hypothetical protein VK844_05535 [Hyphomicrobiales bacterium]|nr:hypothetical protein [Hyphomicrobiales bacterium]
MTTTIKKISELAETLSKNAQEDLLHVAEHMASPTPFYDRMTPDQRAELERAIAEADSGSAVSPAELERRLNGILAKHEA